MKFSDKLELLKRATKDDIQNDIKSVEYLSKIAGKPNLNAKLKPFKSK